MNKRIISNKAKCNKCNTIIESKYRHDFVTCPCGSLSVDGGKEYCRRCYDEKIGYTELSEYEDIKRAMKLDKKDL